MTNMTPTHIDNPSARQVFALMQQQGAAAVFSGDKPHKFSARCDLWLIAHAWGKGLDLESMADGFGPGLGTMGGDWSGVRDSSDAAIVLMCAAAVTFLQKRGDL